MLAPADIAPHQVVPLTRAGYHHLAQLGLFEGRRVQLIYGTVIQMRLGIAASDDSEPEPDFTFVERSTDVESLPKTALLVVEVADSSLKLDLGSKARLYAECKVPEYWVLDVRARSTVVHRKPHRGRYTSVRRVAWTVSLASTALPTLTARFADLLAA